MNHSDVINEIASIKQDLSTIQNRKDRESTISITDTASPKELLRGIPRNKWLIIAIGFVFFMVAILILSNTPERYTAEALLMLEGHSENALGLPSFTAIPTVSDVTIESEIQVIKSPALAGKVIKLLHLEKDPEFNKFLEGGYKKPEPFDITSYLSDIEQIYSGKYIDINDKDTYKYKEIRQVSTILKTYYDGLSVTRQGMSRVIRIEYSAQDPVTATNMANAIADQYIQRQREVKYREIDNAAEWLDDRIKPLQNKVEESETAVENFRKDSGLLENKGTTLISQDLSELNNQLIEAKEQYDKTMAKLNQLNTLMESPQNAGSITTVRTSPLIQHFQMKEAELQQKLGELSVDYGPQHPVIIQLSAEIGNIRKNINKEIKNIANNLENESKLEKIQILSIQQRLDDLMEKVASSNNARVKLRALEREAEANRVLLETFLTQFKAASTQRDMDAQQPDAQILSRAIVPMLPSFPKPVPILAMTFVGSAVMAMLLIIIYETMDRGLLSVGLVEKYTGLPSLGYIPVVKGKDALGKSLESYQIKLPQSPFSDAIKTLYTNILLTWLGKPPKFILITSSQQNEGKTTIANALAMSRSLAGQKTIIIDTEFRRNNINKVFNNTSNLGLVEILNGDASIEEVIQTDDETGTNMIPSGSLIKNEIMQNPADLLMSKEMDNFINTLNQTYDLVIFDSSPVLDSLVGRILMNKVDTTIFVTKWKSTKLEIIRKSLNVVISENNNISGVLLNMVNEKKHSRYGYRCPNYT